MPFLSTLDAGVAAVNQGGRRKGAACVYLEPWHPDIEEFLELRDNTGEDARRTHNLNLANWIPDEFMRRVEADGDVVADRPDQAPELPDLCGDEFDAAYRRAEEDGRYIRQVKARDLYGRMMRTLAQTGNGWMTFKDPPTGSATRPGAAPGEHVVHLSNLCTEILEVNSDGETAVCNLGSINLAAHLTADGIDWDQLRETVRTAVPFLDRVIDINYYPSDAGRRVQPALAAGRPRADGPAGRVLRAAAAVRLRRGPGAVHPDAEEIYLTALETSADLAERTARTRRTPRPAPRRATCSPTCGAPTPTQPERWAAVRAAIAEHGLRNSLLIAIAPTATIASIAGCYECIEPQVSNLFKRETLSGEFLQINTSLVRELKARGLWTPEVREQIKRAEGSVQGIDRPAGATCGSCSAPPGSCRSGR